MDLDHIGPDCATIDKATAPRIVDLANAGNLARNFHSFESPPESEIRKLKPGDFVKLARNQERFWVCVSGYIGRRWHGSIANDLKRNDDLSRGESIFFMRKNIYDLKRDDR